MLRGRQQGRDGACSEGLEKQKLTGKQERCADRELGVLGHERLKGMARSSVPDVVQRH